MSNGDQMPSSPNNPSRLTRFVKGQSGNPRGRPKGRHREAPYEAVLGRTVVIRDHSVERMVTAAEAFLLHMTKQGLNGDGHAMRATLAALENIEHRENESAEQPRIDLAAIFDHAARQVEKYGHSDTLSVTLCDFNMATKLDRYRSTTRTMLKPWLVQAALDRLGDRRLTSDEQKIVIAATHSPSRVDWPEWWTEHPSKDGATV